MDSREGRSRAERRKTPEAACSCLQLAVCTILARSIARSPLSTARSRSRTAPPRTTSPRRRSAPRTSAPVATLAALALFALFAPFAALACSITAHHPSAPEHHPSSERETARCRNWTARLLRVRSSLPTRAPPKRAVTRPHPEHFLRRGGDRRAAQARSLHRSGDRRAAQTRSRKGDRGSSDLRERKVVGQSRFSRARPRSRPRRGRSLGGTDSGKLDHPSSPVRNAPPHDSDISRPFPNMLR